MMVLAADMGGTKTLLSLFQTDADGHRPRPVLERRYASGDYADVLPLMQDFLAAAREHGPVAAACLAIAGPVEGDARHQRAQLTNLPWHLDNIRLAEELGIPHIHLVNDFAGIAHSLDVLGDEDLVTLQTGKAAPPAARLIVGAGTGLGVCALCPEGEGEHQILATEGGHAGFAPSNAQEARLLAHVAGLHGRCTREHLLSGKGIVRIFDFLRDYLEAQPTAALAAAMTREDGAAALSAAALAGTDPLAHETLRLFARIYASQLGDLALTFLPRGGVYIAGGIAPKILPYLQAPEFIETFKAKPPMRHLLETLPVRVIREPAAGLLGAASHAARLARKNPA